MERFNVNIEKGLTLEEVEIRKREGLSNILTTPRTRSIKQIVIGHIFTIFNLLNLSLALLILLVKSYRNLMFLGVVFCNTIIGIIQEVKAKKTVDKLSLITSKKVNVLRNGKWQNIDFEEVVLDDIVSYKLGDQIVADGTILSGNCEVNESFVTGEADAIMKKEGDTILSGSFIVSGNIITLTEKVGKENYTSRISDGAKYVKKISSEIVITINKVLKLLSIIIVPLGILLFLKQNSLPNSNFQMSIVNTVAALIGMIPEGLVLLTSSVFAVSIIRLSRQKVLAQDLYCIEDLARIDTLCLDKTGTITEGNMEIYDIILLKKHKKEYVEDILKNICCNLDDDNPTMSAIRKVYFSAHYEKAQEIISFSSIKKYSGIKIKNKYYLLGAFDYLLDDNMKKTANEKASDNRVLALVEMNNIEKNLKNNTPVALILLRDKIRSSATETLDYFKKQKVDIKIISGDNPVTVSNIAKRVLINGADKYVDASILLTDDDIKKAVSKYNIFGRVKPEQKKIIIEKLKEIGHNVGYVGDGVNDVLALKQANCSITFESAASAARNVSQLVLLDSDFSSIPKIVAEGRRTINNVERSASLFLVKTTYSLLLTILFLFIHSAYPFIPIQLTLTSVVTIGIPSFVLALEPNHDRVKGHFFPKVISKSLPAALTIFINIIMTMVLKELFYFSSMETTTICVLLTGMTGFILLFRLCKPFNIIRIILLVSMIGMFYGQVIGLKTMYQLATITPYMGIFVISLTIISYFIFNLMMNLVDKYVIPKINSEKN